MTLLISATPRYARTHIYHHHHHTHTKGSFYISMKGNSTLSSFHTWSLAVIPGSSLSLTDIKPSSTYCHLCLQNIKSWPFTDTTTMLVNAIIPSHLASGWQLPDWSSWLLLISLWLLLIQSWKFSVPYHFLSLWATLFFFFTSHNLIYTCFSLFLKMTFQVIPLKWTRIFISVFHYYIPST